MRLKCLVGFHVLDRDNVKLVGSYDVGLIDNVKHKKGAIYVYNCQHCAAPVLEYHPEVDFIALTRENSAITSL